ncbi:MAG: FecR domain-containing protein [Sphingobium sp.]
MNNDRDRELVERAASAWLVCLDDDPGDEAMRAEFEQWLTSDPLHQAIWDETQRLDRLIVAAAPMAEVEKSPATILSFPVRDPRPVQRFLVGVAVAACLGWLIGPDLLIRIRAQQVTGTGEVRKVVLSDGSIAYMAPGSAIAFHRDDRGRELDLLRGRAFFDVAHDTAHPFRVKARDAEVKVLGTAFEVRFDAEHLGVEVRRGRVQVRYAAAHVDDRLSPGQTLSFGWAGSVARGDRRPDRIAAWTRGRLAINDRPVGEVIDALRPWFGGYILARGPGLAARHVTGFYNLKDPDAALDALARAHPIRIQSLSPWLRIVTVD